MQLVLLGAGHVVAQGMQLVLMGAAHVVAQQLVLLGSGRTMEGPRLVPRLVLMEAAQPYPT